MNPFTYLVLSIIELYSIVLYAWVILGILIYFKIINSYQPFVQRVEYALSQLVEPALRPIRKILPHMGGVDFSPIVLILLLNFLQRLVLYYF